jgi:hypothetical protein
MTITPTPPLYGGEPTPTAGPRPSAGPDPDGSALLPADVPSVPKPVATANKRFGAALERFNAACVALDEASVAAQHADAKSAPKLRAAQANAQHEREVARQEALAAQQALAAAVAEHRGEWADAIRDERAAVADAIVADLDAQRDRFEALRQFDHLAALVEQARGGRFANRSIRQLGSPGRLIRWDKAAERERKSAASPGTGRLWVEREPAHLLAALSIAVQGRGGRPHHLANRTSESVIRFRPE